MLQNLGYRDINPLICGWEDCDPGHSFGPAVRDYYLLHYLRSGRGTFVTGGSRYSVEKGQIFVIHPNETTYYEADLTTPWRYTWVGFSADIPLPGCLASPVINARDCEHIFAALSSADPSQRVSELYVLSKIFELLALLSRTDDDPKSPAERYTAKAKNFMQSSYMEDISVANIARHMGLDRSYFSRIFTKYEGISPSQYLVSLRLARAAELLSEKSCTPAEAAQGCGYFDAVNFSRMFRRRYGVSPSQYRKKRLR